jgi:ribosome-associated translation inhibitor RaiA
MTIELGGNIVLVGFKPLDYAELIVIKKIVGNYARRFSDTFEGFEQLSLTLKEVHKTVKSQKYELNAKVMVKGRPYTSEVVDRNLFVALDSALQKVNEELMKTK